MRAVTLSNDTVISLLNGYFVPVYTYIEDYQGSGGAPYEEKQAYQKIYRAALEKKLRTGTVFGYLTTPQGDPIDTLPVGGSPEELTAALKRAIEVLGTREGKALVEPRPQNPPPEAEPDALILHLTARPVAGSNGSGFWHDLVGEDWIVYSRKDWTKFLPAGEPAPGSTWEVDREVAIQLLNYFYPTTENNKIQDNEIKQASMKATLVSKDRVRLDVSLQMGHHSLPLYVYKDKVKLPAPMVHATAVGVVDIDPTKKMIRRFVMATEKATYNSGIFGVAVRSLQATREAPPQKPPVPAPSSSEAMLFDFEGPADVEAWSSAALAGNPDKEPEVKIARSSLPATSGGACLELTFDGGQWPAVMTKRIPIRGNWKEFQLLKADLTVDRACCVGFRIHQAEEKTEKGQYGTWNRTALLEPGKNEITVSLHETGYAIPPEAGEVTSFSIYLYKPEKGQTIYLDHVRLTGEPSKIPWDEFLSPNNRNGFSTSVMRQWERTKALQKFKVAGTDWVVQDINELGKLLKAGWTPPPEKTLEDEEREFRELYRKLKESHPRAVLATFREGEAGYDPAAPDRVFEGWKDTYLTCHGPDGPNEWRTKTQGRQPSLESFMRHRCLLLRVDLESISKGSNILAARFLLTRQGGEKPQKPSLYVAEPCNRAWDEATANCYEFAAGKLWKAVSGLYYGEDPDCHPVFLAYGFPGGHPVSGFDFKEAVRFWTGGDDRRDHENHGFMFFGQADDYTLVSTREAKEVKKRPALLVIYEPKS